MKYQIIYADPPWLFKTYSEKAQFMANKHYPCMNIDDIYNLPVKDIASDNCILFLWVTFPMLQYGLETIKQWGFNYKTCAFTWVKTNKVFPFNGKVKSEWFLGMGYWTRSNAEICLLATRGNPKRVSCSVRQLVISPRGRHSAKPPEIRNRIVQLCGDLPRIELFARDKVDGWNVWGNEVKSDITL